MTCEVPSAFPHRFWKQQACLFVFKVEEGLYKPITPFWSRCYFTLPTWDWGNAWGLWTLNCRFSISLPPHAVGVRQEPRVRIAAEYGREWGRWKASKTWCEKVLLQNARPRYHQLATMAVKFLLQLIKYWKRRLIEGTGVEHRIFCRWTHLR